MAASVDKTPWDRLLADLETMSTRQAYMVPGAPPAWRVKDRTLRDSDFADAVSEIRARRGRIHKHSERDEAQWERIVPLLEQMSAAQACETVGRTPGQFKARRYRDPEFGARVREVRKKHGMKTSRSALPKTSGTSSSRS